MGFESYPKNLQKGNQKTIIKTNRDEEYIRDYNRQQGWI